MTSTITLELLKKQNAETSNALMEYWKDSKSFDTLASREGSLTLKRDEEDGIKLQIGIDYAKSKNVIDPNYVPEPYVEIDVLGKTPDQVADAILDHVEKKESGNTGSGSVIVLCGLSGTGKVCIFECACCVVDSCSQDKTTANNSSPHLLLSSLLSTTKTKRVPPLVNYVKSYKIIKVNKL